MHRFALLVIVAVVAVAAAAFCQTGSDASVGEPSVGADTRAAEPSEAAVPPAASGWEALDFRQARMLCVQYRGRVMPMDTMARHVIWQITGSRTWGGHEPTGLLLAWTWQPQVWAGEPVILVRDPALQGQVGLAQDRKRFSYSELSGNAGLLKLAMEAEQHRQADEQLGPMHRNALQVWTRMTIMADVMDGRLLRIVPPAQDAGGAWSAADKVVGYAQGAQEQIHAAYGKWRSALLDGDAAGFVQATAALRSILASLGSPVWPNDAIIKKEVFYNVLSPFRLGWVLCFVALVIGLVALGFGRVWIVGAAVVLLVGAFGAQTLGILLRWQIAGRAPLATMYESLIFMGWGVTAIGLVAIAVLRHRAAVPIVAAVATAWLVVADFTPLDWTVSPLVPVLRNTVWLTYHVLTIMLGYAGLALAMGVGHVQAGLLAYRPEGKEWPALLGRLLYGLIMVGVVFLTAGIITGAIWADSSWGRYWGWDPKETWSLIALLGYMAVLHGRRVGWLGQFGLAVASIVCFQLVVMTYYGVNFVLGVGLHSYGFGSGGLRWIALYELIECAFVAWMWLVRSRSRRLASVAG